MRGGPRKGAGRKPGLIPQTLSKTIRWNPAEWATIEVAAENVNETTSEFVRTAALERAKRSSE